MASELKVNTITEATSGSGITFAKDIIPATPLSHRNMIINGAMQVAQRYSSPVTSVATGYNTADRWRTFQSGAGTFTQSIENDGPAGFPKSLKMLCTTNDSSIGNADRLWVGQKIEGQNLQSLAYGTSSAKTATLSFYVKSNATGTYIAYLYTPSGRSVSLSYTIGSSGSWERKTVTIPADTSQAVTNDNAERLDVRFFLASGTNYTSGTLNTTWGTTANVNTAAGQTNLAAADNNYWQITGVQLELGSVATPFEHRSYADELARCQRYYWKITGNLYQQFALYRRHNTNNRVFPVHLPVPMRHHTPTITNANLGRWSSAVGSWSTTYSTIDFYDTIDSPNNFTLAPFQMTGAGSGDDAGIMGFQANGYLTLDAEL